MVNGDLEVVCKKDFDSIEVSVVLSKYPRGIYRVEVIDYDKYFIRGVFVLDEKVARLIYDMIVSLLAVADKTFQEAEGLDTEEDEKRFVEKFSKIGQMLKKILDAKSPVQ